MNNIIAWRNSRRLYGFLYHRYVNSSQMKKMSTEGLDKPLKYINSEAAKWPARKTRLGSSEEIPDIQPFVITTSLAVFMLYFFILREENDIDLKLDQSLDSRIPGIEKQHLLNLHERYLDNGKDVTAIEKRLKEILIAEKQQKQN